mgnify:CR=1 FL=1
MLLLTWQDPEGGTFLDIHSSGATPSPLHSSQGSHVPSFLAFFGRERAGVVDLLDLGKGMGPSWRPPSQTHPHASPLPVPTPLT